MRSRLPHAFLAAFAAVALASCAGAATRTAGLTPAGSDAVRRAAAGLAPELSLKSLAIPGAHADVTLCAAATGDCFDVRLDDPEAGCAGEVAGPWCVTYPGARPDAAMALRIAGALAAAGGDVWSRESASPTVAAPPPTASDVALAAFIALLPPLAGFAGGRLARGRRRRPWIAAGFAAALVAAPFVVPAPPEPFGFWDAAWVAWSAAVAIAAGLPGRPGASRGSGRLLVASAVAALAVLEAGSRLLWPRPPLVVPAGRVIGADEVDATPVRLDPRSGMPFPDDPGYVEARLAQAGKGAFRVLHLGDSMVYGTGVARAERFDSLLASLEPGSAQVNGGVPGTGPDYALLAMRSFARAARFDLVVEHVFVGNDLEDIDRVYAGCGGPLLEYGPEGPRQRCFAGGEGRSRLADPPPWPLRIATSFSTFARQACGLWLGARVPPPGATLEHLGAILSTMRDEARASGSRFAVVLLPVRTAIEDAVAVRETVRAGRTVHRDIASRARAEGIDVFDAWGLIEDSVRREGAAPWFLRDRPDEPHLSAKGQALFADWLDRGLRDRGLVPSPQETEQP